MKTGIQCAVVSWVLFLCACGTSHNDLDTMSGDDRDTTLSDSDSSDNTEDTSGEESDPPLPACTSSLDIQDESIFDPMRQGFEIRLGDGGGYLWGGVLSGRPPSFHKESERIGDCRLLTYKAASCPSSCEGDAQCFNGECVFMPSSVSMGALTVRDSSGFQMEVPPRDDNLYYMKDESFRFEEGKWVSISLSVSNAPVELITCAPPPVIEETSFTDLLDARGNGADAVLRWTETDSAARIYLRMTTCIGSHGGISPVEIECEGRDKGELTIPGSFLDALDCPECWTHGNCGEHELIRYHSDEVIFDDFVVRMNNMQALEFYYFPGNQW